VCGPSGSEQHYAPRRGKKGQGVDRASTGLSEGRANDPQVEKAMRTSARAGRSSRYARARILESTRLLHGEEIFKSLSDG
jgi:hypothetical protein